MLTRERIEHSLTTEPNNGHVYGFHNIGSIHPIQARDIATDSGIAFDAQTGNMDRAKRGEISAGDFIRCADGKLERVAKVWNQETQNGLIEYQPGQNGTGGGFYLNSASMSFSCWSLDYSVSRRVELSGEILPARVWFFSLRQAGAGRGVYCSIGVPVWREVSP
jgi:hypothetical protein